MRIAIFENIMTPGGLEPSEEVSCAREPCDGDAEAQEFDDCLGGDLYGVDECESLKSFGGDFHDTFPVAPDGEASATFLDVCAFLGDVGKTHGAVSFPRGFLCPPSPRKQGCGGTDASLFTRGFRELLRASC